jgi:hypothetical protein
VILSNEEQRVTRILPSEVQGDLDLIEDILDYKSKTAPQLISDARLPLYLTLLTRSMNQLLHVHAYLRFECRHATEV